MVGHLRKSCLDTQFEAIKERLEEGSLYNTKDKLLAGYPESVRFFPYDVKQVAYKNHAKSPIKLASQRGELVRCSDDGRKGLLARYAFPLKIVESMIDQILEKDNCGHVILDQDDNIISKPFFTREEAEYHLATNDRYSSQGGYLITYYRGNKYD